jgi:hypothetical protein
MRSLYTFKLAKIEAVLIASNSSKLLELEKKHGFRFEPTGIVFDSFGKSFVASHFKEWQIYDLPRLRNYIKWSERVGAPL